MSALVNRDTPAADPNVDYVKLATAECEAREEYPNAAAVVALWTPANSDTDVCVEIWTRDEATGLMGAEVIAWPT